MVARDVYGSFFAWLDYELNGRSPLSIPQRVGTNDKRGSTVQKGSFRKNVFLPWADALGPAKTLYLYDPDAGLEAVIVLDNLTLGPVIGGVRMVPL
jgi:hypothetical protein